MRKNCMKNKILSTVLASTMILGSAVCGVKVLAESSAPASSNVASQEQDLAKLKELVTTATKLLDDVKKLENKATLLNITKLTITQAEENVKKANTFIAQATKLNMHLAADFVQKISSDVTKVTKIVTDLKAEIKKERDQKVAELVKQAEANGLTFLAKTIRSSHNTPVEHLEKMLNDALQAQANDPKQQEYVANVAQLKEVIEDAKELMSNYDYALSLVTPTNTVKLASETTHKLITEAENLLPKLTKLNSKLASDMADKLGKQVNNMNEVYEDLQRDAIEALAKKAEAAGLNYTASIIRKDKNSTLKALKNLLDVAMANTNHNPGTNPSNPGTNPSNPHGTTPSESNGSNPSDSTATNTVNDEKTNAKTADPINLALSLSGLFAAGATVLVAKKVKDNK